MSSDLTEASPINLLENAPVIAPSKACKGFNILLESTPVQNKYKGVNWDCID